MNKIISRLKTKNIQDLYEIQSITENGCIRMKNANIVIYEIDPANIVACDNETKHRIYQAYLSCIRSLPDAFQILITRECTDFEEQIRQYKSRLSSIENINLKFALKKYIEHLQNLSNTNKLYKTSHYLVLESKGEGLDNSIINIFSNLKEFGVKINLIKSKEKASNILKKFATKDKEHGFN